MAYSLSNSYDPRYGSLENIKNCKSLQEFKKLLKYRNPNLTLAESAKSTLQILVKFD